MIAEYIERQRQLGESEISVSRSVPMPGVTAYSCKVSTCSQPHPVKVSPDHFEAVFCLTGRLQIQLADGQTTVVGPGSLLLLTSAVQAEYLFLELAPVCFLAVTVDKQTVLSSFGEQAPPPPLFDWTMDTKCLQEHLDARKGCMVLHDPDWSNSTLSSLRRLPPERHGVYFTLRLLERLCVLCSEPPPDPSGSQGCYYDFYQRETVRKVRDYMLENVEQQSTIQMLAQKFQMSPTHLKESFRRIYGKPIHTYLQQYRLQKAAHLLCTTSDSVLTIASRVGYAGTSRFNAAFKEMYHMTPMQYRRMNSSVKNV